MSCGNPHEMDCREILDHLYEYLDNEMAEGECAKFQLHIHECHPCLEMYGLEAAVKKLVKRCCGSDEVPSDLRDKVLGRIDAIRAGHLTPTTGPGRPAAQPGARAASRPGAAPAPTSSSAPASASEATGSTPVIATAPQSAPPPKTAE